MGDTGVINTEEMGAGLRATQVLGLTSTAFLCGNTFSNSFSTTPAFLLSPAPLLAKQWKKMLDSEGPMAPAIVVFSSGIFGCLAYKEPSLSTTTARLYATSASLLALIIPYSFLTVHPIAEKLKAKAAAFDSTSMSSLVDTTAEHGIKKEETVHYLVDRWATFNVGRTVLTGLAAILSTWAAVERLKVSRFRVVSGAERLKGLR